MKKFTTKYITKEKLPLVIEPAENHASLSSLSEILQNENKTLRKELLTHGGLLFRNFPIQNEDHFELVIDKLNLGKCIDYIGGDSPRHKIKGGIYTSTEAPPSMKIPLHNELSFIDKYPKHIYFYCHIAPQEKGETTIADARQVYRSVREDVKQRLRQKGIKYVSNYFFKSKKMDWITSKSHKSWINVFETSDKKEVEKKCRENNFEFKWSEDDWLQICQKRPAVITHPETEENVWFNQAHLYDFNPKLLGLWRYLGTKVFYNDKTRLHDVFYADGTPIPRDDLYHIMDVLEQNSIYFPWQKGDVLVLDNVLSMHGRSTFTGKRRVLAAMTG